MKISYKLAMAGGACLGMADSVGDQRDLAMGLGTALLAAAFVALLLDSLPVMRIAFVNVAEPPCPE